MIELIITYLATLFYPPKTKEPNKQNIGSVGKPSDHNVIIAAPRTDLKFKTERHKKKVHICPLPLSNIASFMKYLGTHEYTEVTNTADLQKEQNLGVLCQSF